jgi:hypothetical protein
MVPEMASCNSTNRFGTFNRPRGNIDLKRLNSGMGVDSEQ